MILPHSIENINQDKEQSDEQSHSSRHHIGSDQERDPRHHDEEETRQVDLEDQLGTFAV